RLIVRRAVAAAPKAGAGRESEDPGAGNGPAKGESVEEEGAPAAVAPAEEPLIIDLSQAGSIQKTVRGTRYLDLTAHPWAGLKVIMQLEAKDAIDQAAMSEPVEIVLPEREFKHPVARALVEARKDLMRDPIENREVVA